ncbi:MAG TPA: type II toxin-antitoxin system prevent-host-death family antitoxin [Terriglobia bacterium]|jgi:prevent-host-death family protein
MAKNVIHISDTEAKNDFGSLLERVRSGTEVIIEHDTRPIAVVRPIEARGRLLSESIALAESHASRVTLDGGFARDLEEIVNSHQEPLSPPKWD